MEISLTLERRQKELWSFYSVYKKPKISNLTLKRSRQILVVYAHLDAQRCTFTIDTGESRSLILIDFVQKLLRPTVKNLVLEAAEDQTEATG